MLTQERLKYLLLYEPDCGEWYWISSPSPSVRIGQEAGHRREDGYLRISVDGTLYYAGPLAWLYMTGEWPKEQIDHENQNRHDYRWSNLREATWGQNMANRSLPFNNTTGYRGISLFQGKWEVRVNTIYFGRYDDLEEAIEVRDSKALELQGEFAVLNNPYQE